MNRHETVATMLGRTSLIIATLVSPAVNAQITAKGFATKPMLVAPISGVEGKEIVLLDVSMDPGASSPCHTHPGDCYGAILEGTVELVVEGQDPRRFTAGQAWHNPRGPVHYFRNVGTSPARLQNTLVVDQGKPRTVTQP